MEIVIPKDTKLYKGLPVSCKTLLKDVRNFFVTLNPRVASEYGKTTCAYITRKNLRLFVLSNANVKKIKLSSKTRIGLSFALGTNVLRWQQAKAYKLIMSGKTPLGFRNRPMNRGERLSVADFDKDVFMRLSMEFLLKNGYDGFYSPAKKSGFHAGSFPSEIMICIPEMCMARIGSESNPVLSRVSVIRNLPRLFINYCRKNRALLKSYRNYFVPELGGGMGVKLYLEARGAKASRKVLNTKDFDFTFAVSNKIRDWKRRFEIMKTIMSKQVFGFISWLNRTYTNTGAKISIHEFIPDIKDLPATKKHVYKVCQFRIQFPGKELMDFIDCTLAYVPGSSCEDLNPVYSKMYGLPIPRLAKLYKSVAVVLAGSFVYTGIKGRNPIYGNKPEKGQKNVARLGALQNLAQRNVKVVRHLIDKIKKRNVKGAKLNANKIISYIKRKTS
jgi:hypothetical protein